jgi:D-beta-D-heptose 7-phosphate kinase/D-beta-D-heptose 1-phosphate adenosyltransferase
MAGGTVTHIVDSLAGVRALVAGDLMLDKYLWGHPTRISPESPVMVVEIDRETDVPGGAANVANNVLALGGHAVVAGVVGDDREGEALLRRLAEAGADAGGVVVDPGRPTTTKTRLVAQSQQLMRFDRERVDPVGGGAQRALASAMASAFGKVDVAVVSDYSKGVVSEAFASAALAGARAAGIPLVLNAKPGLAAAFRGADLVTVNRAEALAVLGGGPPDDLARRVRDRLGVGAAVATLGPDGLEWCDGTGSGRVAARAVEVYDVAGAGDTVVTVLAMAFARGAPIAEAARVASLAASIVVGKLGVATASLDELRSLC